MSASHVRSVPCLCLNAENVRVVHEYLVEEDDDDDEDWDEVMAGLESPWMTEGVQAGVELRAKQVAPLHERSCLRTHAKNRNTPTLTCRLTHTHTHTRTHTYACTHIHIYTYTRATHTHTHTHSHTHTHIYTRTHTLSRCLDIYSTLPRLHYCIGLITLIGLPAN